MLIALTKILAPLSSMFRSRAALGLENLALRHQIGVLQRSARKRPKLHCGPVEGNDMRHRLHRIFVRDKWDGPPPVSLSLGAILEKPRRCTFGLAVLPVIDAPPCS
jgi:hypothetical protein